MAGRKAERGRKKRKQRNEEKNLIVGTVLALGLLVIGLFATGLIKPFTPTATVWITSGGTGYVCFLDYSDARGGPLCLDDVHNNATIPFGQYTIVYFATRIPQDTTFNGFAADGGLTVGNWTDYDQSFSYQAPLTVQGNGTISVSWSNATPIPEFPSSTALLVPLALVVIVGVLRFRRTRNVS